MADRVPDYYRQFAKKRPPKPTEAARPTAHRRRTAPPVDPPAMEYRAHDFTLRHYEPWKDETAYVLGGPVADEIRHNLTVAVGREVEADSLVDFADWQVKSVEETLQGCRLLLKDRIELECGLPAYRAIFVWYPSEELRIYQEQVYVLHETTGYTLTASFSKKTRKTLGPRVERMMMSFTPAGCEPAPASPRRRY